MLEQFIDMLDPCIEKIQDQMGFRIIYEIIIVLIQALEETIEGDNMKN
jgi:hypothetical protein